MNQFLVLDKNVFAHELTGHWLAESESNTVVLTDFSYMETYNTGNLNNILNDFSVLKHFPNQVVKMKNNDSLNLLSGRFGKKSDLINWDETEELTKFLINIKAGKYSVDEAAVINNSKIANDKIAQIGTRISKNKEVMDNIGPQLRRFIIGKTPDGLPKFTRKGLNGVKELALNLAFLMSKRNEQSVIKEDSKEFRNSFIFRYALACISSMVMRLSRGSLVQLSDEKARNDIIDCNYIACSTYWDGLLTNDEHTKLSHAFLSNEMLT